MSLDEMRGVMRDLAKLGCKNVTLLGGEFLLRADWYEIGEAVKAVGMALQLITNGLLVDGEIRERFKALKPRVIGVSFDGATPESYRATRGVDGFAKCRKLLDDLLSDGHRRVNAITTFTSRNLGDFDKFLSEFIDTPIVWQVQVVHKAGERFDDSLLLTQDQFAWYMDRVTYCHYELKDRISIGVMDDFGYFPLTPKLAFLCQTWDGCPAGRRVIGIRANGDVLPCLSLGSAFIEDNLRRRPLAEIWKDPKLFAKFRNKADCTGKCGKCPMAAKCKAGCSAAAVSTTGSLTENLFCIRRIETKRLLDAVL